VSLGVDHKKERDRPAIFCCLFFFIVGNRREREGFLAFIIIFLLQFIVGFCSSFLLMEEQIEAHKL
jgi:hypothetical protein